jgi:hypothetical protein
VDVLTAQRTAGNRAVTLAVQRKAPRGSVKFAKGFDAAVPNFLDVFGNYTRTENFSAGMKVFQEDTTGDRTLDEALRTVRWAMNVITNGQLADQVPVVAARWDMVRPAVDKALTWAWSQSFPALAARQGLARFERRLHGWEASVAIHSGAATATFTSPAGGLYDVQDKQLLDSVIAWQVLHQKVLALQWSTRHTIRAAAAGAAVVGALRNIDSENVEIQVRYLNMARTALGWAVLWKEFGSLQERFDAAKKRGMIPAAATIASFVSHAGSVISETTNLALRHAQTLATWQFEYWARLGQETGISQDVMALKWEGRAKAFAKWSRMLSAGSGVLQVVSGALDLINAIENDDARAGVAAGHTIAQGGIAIGGAVLGAGTVATTAVSGAVALIWIEIDILFQIADIIEGFKNMARLEKIARMLTAAESLIPWGKRMAGAADAIAANVSADPAHRAGVEEAILKQAAEPFGIVVSHLVAIRAAINGEANLPNALGATGRQALSELSFYEYFKPGDPFSPAEIISVTELCRRLFPALARAGRWAAATYGPNRDSKESKALRKQLESAD